MELSFSQVAAAAGWVAAAIINLSVLYGLYETYHTGKPLTPDVEALYTAVSRFAWCVGLAWVTVACLTGYGGKHKKDFIFW